MILLTGMMPTEETMKKTLLFLSLVALIGCGGSGGTTPPPTTPDYFTEMNPSLRWSSAKTTNPLKVFIGTDGGTDRSEKVKQALNSWTTGTSNLVRFEQTADEAAADIVLEFSGTVNPADGGLGKAEVTFLTFPGNPTADGTIAESHITIKVGLSDALLVPVVTHEVGHALGIVARTASDVAHSSYSGDIMYQSVNASSTLSTRDTATLAKLYALSRHR